MSPLSRSLPGSFSAPNFYASFSSTLLVRGLLAGSLFVYSSAVMAQDQALEEVVITASRTPQELQKVGSTVHIIDSAELEKHGQDQLKDYLERLPGISFAQNGPQGTTSTIRMRGATAKYIKVLIDGIDISDPSSTQTQPDFSHFLVGDIERIEVLKGSQGTLYGGDAVAGVISITTKSAGKGLSLRANAEYGSYNTKRGSATLGYGGEKGAISFSAQGVKTRGFSAADENAGNSEKDGYDNVTFSGRGHYNLGDTFKVYFAARSFKADVAFDEFVFGAPGNIADGTFDNHTITKQRAGRVGVDFSLFDGKFKNDFSVQAMKNERNTVASFSPDGSLFEGNRLKLDYKGQVEFHQRFSLMFGAQSDATKSVSTSDPIEHSARVNGVFAQAIMEPVDNINLTAGIRRDDHDAFGTFNTFRLTGAWYVPTTDTKFHGSYGTGFRAPSLFELFSPSFGNQNLSPEESISWDIGVDQALLDGKLTLSATYFSLNTNNLVQFNFPAGYSNVEGTTRRQGVELAAQADFTDWISASASYTYTDAREEGGERLVRAPRHLLTLGTEIKPVDKLSLNISANIINDVVDSGDVTLKDYMVVNAKLSYDINETVSAYIRGENLFDKDYQSVNGYGTSDRAFYAGIRMKLGGE